MGVDLNAPPETETAPTGPTVPTGPVEAELEEPPLVAMGGGQPEGTFEAAQARVAGGDFGTPERPLKLEGELSDYERAMREVESVPRYQEAISKAEAAEQEAETLWTTLLTEGRAFDPEVYKSLAEEAKRKEQLGKSFRGIAQRYEQANEQLLAVSEKNSQAIMRDIIRELATGNRMEGLERLRQEGALSMAKIRGAVNSLPGLWKLRTDKSPGVRERALEAIAENLRIIAAGAESRADNAEARDRLRMFGENAEQNAEELLNMEQEDMLSTLERLRERFGFSSEMQEMMEGRR